MKRIALTLTPLLLAAVLSGCTVPADITSSINAGALATPGTMQTGKAKAAHIKIAKAVLVDEAGVKISAKSIDPDEQFGIELTLPMENDSPPSSIETMADPEFSFHTHTSSDRDILIEASPVDLAY